LVPGDAAKYAVVFQGATFAFANEPNASTFKSNPANYIPDVGGYCLGAMSQRRITQGDPRNFFFVPEEIGGGMWAIYGSSNGPKAWASMTPDERRAALTTAHAYYYERTGGTPSDTPAPR
jgi:YHS domain-containing protein